jgi:hypothetical protein
VEVTVPEPDIKIVMVVPLVLPPPPVLPPVPVLTLELVVVVPVVPVSPPPPQAVRKILRMRDKKNTARPAVMNAIMPCVPFRLMKMIPSRIRPTVCSEGADYLFGGRHTTHQPFMPRR